MINVINFYFLILDKMIIFKLKIYYNIYMEVSEFLKNKTYSQDSSFLFQQEYSFSLKI